MTGDASCPCYPNRTCNGSLTCLAGTCRDLAASGGIGPGTGGSRPLGGSGPLGGSTPFGGSPPRGGTSAIGGVTSIGGSATGGVPGYSLLDSCSTNAVTCEAKAGDVTQRVIDPIAKGQDDPKGTQTEEFAGRLGYWYVYGNKASAPAARWEGVEGTSPVPQSGDAFRGEAMLVKGTAWGLSDVNYAGIGVGLSNQSSVNCPYDASMYGGLKFYYKAEGAVSLRVTSQGTTPCDNNAEGLCAAQCYDHHQRVLPVATTWTPITVCFADLRPQGWTGLLVSTPLLTTGLLEIQWQSKGAFTIGVDELEFATVAECPGS